MSNQLFPNGTTLQSSALIPEQISTIFQTITAQILGFNVNPPVNPAAYKAVRVGWQPVGQPAWKITEDVVILLAYPENDEFSKVRDQQYQPNDSVSLEQNMSYTQVWRMHWTFYGPNCWDHARLVSSAMSLDWVHDYLANPPAPFNTQLYALASWERPKYVPELKNGQWWKRTDLEMKFNELVKEDIVADSVASAQITLTTETGQTETINIEA